MINCIIIIHIIGAIIAIVIHDILMGFNDEKGIGSKGYNSLAELEEDACEIVKNIGREETDILDIYMLAFKLAKKQLNDKGGNEV